jgi:hypothetical protein
MYGPGTMLFYPDPHFEPPLVTKTGGLMLFCQYLGTDDPGAARSTTAAST